MAELQRVLSKKTIILITINSILGTGLFFLPAKGAGVSGPSSIISWIILSFIALYTIMCFAELVSMFPKSGGIYEYSKRAYGTFPSFMMGWLTWIVENVTIAMLVVGAIDYIMPQGQMMHKILISLFLIMIFNYITLRGVQTSAHMLVLFSCITISMALFVIITSIFDIAALANLEFITNFDISNFSPFFINEGILLNLCLIGFTVFLISETFFGFEGICFLAGETREPEKVLPGALITASLITILIALVFVVSSLGAMNWHELSAASAPYAELIDFTTGPTAKSIFIFGVFFAIIGSAAGMTVTTPRLILSLAEDKLFPTSFAKIHEKYKTPYNAIFFQAIIVSLLIVFTLVMQENAYLSLVKLLVLFVTIMMMFVILIVPILRKKLPNHPRPFSVPFAKIGIPLLTIINLSLVGAWILEDTIEAMKLVKLGASLIICGIPIFLLLITYFDPDIIVKLNNIFAYLNWACERMLLPRKIIMEIDNHLEDIRGKKVLEFGCGVGSLTKEIIKKVGPEGYVYATDISYTSVKIARDRIVKRGHTNIYFLHDMHQVNRVHHSIPAVDVIVSFGMLGYIQDIKKVLREMNSLLPEGGRIFFVDYVDLFKVIPNVSWLSHEEKLKRLFEECGFSVIVRKETSPMWNYLYVYGIKSQHGVPFI